MDTPLRILLIDESVSDADQIKRELQRAGVLCVLQRVNTHESFVAALTESPPDVVLANYLVLDFTALHALHILKKHDYDIPLIVVTDSQSEDIAVACMKAGAADYLPKKNLKQLPMILRQALERHQFEQARRETEKTQHNKQEYRQEYFRLIAENTRDLISLVDMEGRILYITPSSQTLLGHTPEDLTGRSYFSLVHTQDQEKIRSVFQQGSTSREERTAECQYIQPTGKWRYFEFVLNWIIDSKGIPGGLIIAHDISRRRSTEQRLQKSSSQLRALAAHLQIIREEERTRIAREIHDELGQNLTGLKMDVSWINGRITSVPEDAAPVSSLHDKLMSMSGQIDSTIQMVRRIATDLRPGLLDDLGLVSAIEWQVQEFQARTGIRCVFASSGENLDIPQDCTTALFRICQEALTNVARHANATHVDITLRLKAETLTLTVRDNGRGITKRTVENTTSLGLLGMHERALLVGGNVEITGNQGKGTTVMVNVPLKPNGNVRRPDPGNGPPGARF